jgi:hypothetical protein
MTSPEPGYDQMVTPAALAALDMLQQELAKTPAGAPKHERFTPGDAVVAALVGTTSGMVTISECCEGIASVRIGSIFPSTDFPNEDPRPVTAGGPVAYAVELILEVIRCGVQPGPDMAPADIDLTRDARRAQDDAAAMRRVATRLVDSRTVFDAAVGRWEPGSADGDCLSGTLTVTVQVECLEC